MGLMTGGYEINIPPTFVCLSLWDFGFKIVKLWSFSRKSYSHYKLIGSTVFQKNVSRKTSVFCIKRSRIVNDKHNIPRIAKRIELRTFRAALMADFMTSTVQQINSFSIATQKGMLIALEFCLFPSHWNFVTALHVYYNVSLFSSKLRRRE